MSDDFDLNDLVDRALRSKEPDPHVIARRLIAKVPTEHLRDVVSALLADRVRMRVRLQRSDDFAPSHRRSDTHSATAGGSRWERHAPRLRYCVAGDWKFYDDLTAEDCDHVAEDYAARAAANAALEQRFRELAKRLRQSGANRVADLGVDADLGVAA